MYRLRIISCLSSLYLITALADHLGARYPQPVDLSGNGSTISNAWETITSTLQEHVDAAGTNRTFYGLLGLENVTFSIGLFSLNDPNASDMQFHYTSPEVFNGQNGTREVGGDSIYWVASITKLFTVLTGLIELNSTDWDARVTDIFPGLAELAGKTPQDSALDTIEWDRITLGTLAAQISGLPTNPLLLDQLISYLLQQVDPTTEGYPPLNGSDLLANPPCLGYENASCYLPQIAPQAPNFLPWTSPLYSNNNFILLTALMQNITGKDMPSMVDESILRPLDLASTFSGRVPEQEWSRSVVVDPQEYTIPPGLAIGSGGVASTTNDLAKFGIGILNSTLLPSDDTRKWMKPISHTGRLEVSFGRPWEILRYTHASGAVTDMYTKAGDSGTSASYLVIIPDYNAGFSVLGGSTLTAKTGLIGRVGDLVANTLLPALESEAAIEAERNFAGRYVSTVEGLNSSLSLSVNKTAGADPGLLIESFIMNGTDFTESLSLLFSSGARLVPSIVDRSKGLMAFRVSTASGAPSVDISRTLFSGAGLGDYFIGDAASFGGIPLTLFVFDVDSNGSATAVSPAAWRVTLARCE